MVDLIQNVKKGCDLVQMLMHEIAEKLKKYYDIESYIKVRTHMDINDVVICSKNQYIFEDDVLYIVRNSEFNKLISFNKLINIIYISNNAVDLEDSMLSNKNLIIFKGSMDFKVIYKEITSLLEENKKLMFYTARLFKLLFRCKSLQEIIDKSYQILDNPLVIKDLALDVIAYSESPKLNDQVRAFLTSDFVEYYDTAYVEFRDKRQFEKVYLSATPVYVCSEKDYPFIIANVIVDKKIVAYITVVEYQKTFSEFDYAFIQVISNIISLGIKRNELVLSKSKLPYESLIEDILGKNIQNPKVIREKIEIITGVIKEYSNMYIMTIRQTDFENTIIEYIKKCIEKFFNIGQPIMYDGNIVIIINHDKDDGYVENNIRKLQNFLSSNKMYAGVSYCFHNIKNIRKYYDQSLEAIELGLQLKKEERIFFYEDYAVFHMFDLCSKKESLMKLCHPALLCLLEHDRKNKTSLTNDLYVYLNSGQTLVESAQSLHISRRTIADRINKIKQVTGINLGDQNQVFSILISFKMLELCKKQTYKKLV